MHIATLQKSLWYIREQSTVKTPTRFTVEGNLQSGKINQVIHFNSLQDPNEFNLDV